MEGTLPRTSTSVAESPTPASEGRVKSGKKPITFLDLAGEQRNQIYYELLPNGEDRFKPSDDHLVKGSKTSSTNFMATCQQIHREAVRVLYRGKILEVQVSRTGEVRYLNQVVHISEISTANFAVLNQIEQLEPYVSADTTVNVCDVQEALFALLGHLRPNHKLHTLKVHIDVSESGDGVWDIFSSNAADRYFQKAIMDEFRHIRPGDISRAHVTAFLTDPLRRVRNLRHRDARKKGLLTLDFIGKTGRPWREIQGQVRQLIQGDSPVPVYDVFSGYYAIFRPLLGTLKALGLFETYRVRPVKYKLACARIRGDVESFIDSHEHLDAEVGKILKNKALGDSLLSSEETEVREQKIREINYLMQELYAALPDEIANTGFFGYAILDDALEDWQNTGRKDAEVQKEKRKRQREQERKVESRKKAKTDE